MTSTFAWLDASPEEERRIRELVNLFADAESRDELGIGQIRDVYSERLFPGTSVIQTRARYYLFIPWLFRLHEGRGRSGPDLLRRVNASERRLIETLKASPEGTDVDGLIGRRAGAKVKILPSTIYWGGFTRYGILRSPGPADGLLAADAASRDTWAADELTGIAAGNWHPTLPPSAGGFPDEVSGGFALTPEEAGWLKEVLLEAVPGALLAHLVSAPSAPSKDSLGPWDDEVALTADRATIELLDSAELFSLTIHGAALLYNLLLAESYEARGLDAVPQPVAKYRSDFDAWASEAEAKRDDLQAWDLNAWWGELLTHNPRISPPTRLFVLQWINLMQTNDLASLADAVSARDLIAGRERFQKKAQSRLANTKLLNRWTGASGAAQLTFRWQTVRTLVTDIVEGLRR